LNTGSGERFSLLQNVQTGYGAYPASYSMGTGRLYPCGGCTPAGALPLRGLYPCGGSTLAGALPLRGLYPRGALLPA